jgi:threonylcarbamoyladenosine tRNA methylthiotransferase MtaB
MPRCFPMISWKSRAWILVAGNGAKQRLPDLLHDREKGRLPWLISSDFSSRPFSDVLPLSNRTRAMLKVQDGCDSFCSYCIVPYARGPVRSLEPQKVLENLAALADKGYREVVLTGIHLGRYGMDLAPSSALKDLLMLIGRKKLPVRIRLSSLEPKEIGPEIIEMVASESWLCRHFHIPLQSGDDGILKRMNRHYTAREFRSLIERIHTRVPLAAIGADILAGFPGETKRLIFPPMTWFKISPYPISMSFPSLREKGPLHGLSRTGSLIMISGKEPRNSGPWAKKRGKAFMNPAWARNSRSSLKGGTEKGRRSKV